tara:strand:- start:302 stop:682 length:381 start_codon:yes stop_codon:yes gene_type:complete
MLPADPRALTALQMAYYRPQARFDVAAAIATATGGLDISDGLSQDLMHLCAASGCGAVLESEAIPVALGASLEDALYGGDDYELLLASDEPLPGMLYVGTLSAQPGLQLDGKALVGRGFDHFRGIS